eukprot:789140-Pelagomonas_calceolata.AAC.1
MSTFKITRTVTLHETSMQSHAQKSPKSCSVRKYTFVFPQEAQKVQLSKFENSITLKKAKRSKRP